MFEKSFIFLCQAYSQVVFITNTQENQRQLRCCRMVNLNLVSDPQMPHVEPQESHRFSEFNVFIFKRRK